MPIVLGLDGGGSHLRAIAWDENHEVVFRSQGGPANLASTPEGRLRTNFLRTLDSCPRVDAVAGCFAGLIGKERRAFALDLLRSRFPEARLMVEPDWAAALAVHPEADACVIAGTGSLVCSREPSGWQKSGGRGYVLGDEGSGFQLGREALLAFLDDPDQVGPKVRAHLQEQFGTLVADDIIPQVYRGGTPAGVLAKLSKPFFADAKEGRPYALRAIETHSRALALVVSDHLRKFRHGAQSLDIVLAGGTWKASSLWMARFEVELSTLVTETQIGLRKIEKPPVEGACRLAEELLNGN